MSLKNNNSEHNNFARNTNYEKIIEDVKTISDYTNVSMKVAYDYYIYSNKDVVKAIIKLEDNERLNIYEKFLVYSDELVDVIYDLVKKGNINKIIISRNDKIYLTLPVSMGAISIVMFPYLSAIAILAWMFGQFEVIIERNKYNDVKKNEHNKDIKHTSTLIKKMKVATVDKI